MLSRAVGPTYGVSKNAMVTIVRVPPSTGPIEAMAGPAMVSAYVQVFNDIVSKGLGGRAVVIAANGFTATLAGTNSQGYPVQGHRDYPMFKTIGNFAQVGVLVSDLFGLFCFITSVQHSHTELDKRSLLAFDFSIYILDKFLFKIFGSEWKTYTDIYVGHRPFWK